MDPIREPVAEVSELPTRARTLHREFQGFLREAGRAEAGAAGEPTSLRDWVDLAETWKITRTLDECRGNRSAAARILGIGRRTLYAKMDKLGIAPTWSANRGA
jgi:hypothetical protein